MPFFRSLLDPALTAKVDVALAQLDQTKTHIPDWTRTRLQNAPSLTRLESATFTSEFPIAQIALHDSRLPVNVSLDAFSPSMVFARAVDAVASRAITDIDNLRHSN